MTTMEDVFLKVGEMDEIDAPIQELQPKGLAALEISGRIDWIYCSYRFFVGSFSTRRTIHGLAKLERNTSHHASIHEESRALVRGCSLELDIRELLAHLLLAMY